MLRSAFALLLIGTLTAHAADTTLPDPMQPAVTPSKPAAPTIDAAAAPINYTLSAIKIDARHRLAIINNQVVTVGKTVNGARVLKIGPQVVDIQAGETHLALRLNQHDFKHRATGSTHPP